jgi:hypothetical protein
MRILGMLGSAHDGEIAAGGRAADRLIRDAGLRWPDVILPALAGPAPQGNYTVAAVDFVLDRWDLLTDWEIGFAEGIQRQRSPLSPKQRELLDRLVEKARRAEARGA